eukprot:1160381-Pelagomonas_calceolata.AAC.5
MQESKEARGLQGLVKQAQPVSKVQRSNVPFLIAAEARSHRPRWKIYKDSTHVILEGDGRGGDIADVQIRAYEGSLNKAKRNAQHLCRPYSYCIFWYKLYAIEQNLATRGGNSPIYSLNDAPIFTCVVPSKHNPRANPRAYSDAKSVQPHDLWATPVMSSI